MPVRLIGVIAAPEAGGPHPVVLILHGTHPGCPEVEHGVNRWPCDPAVEQPNYRGFAWLTSELAAQGYVALAININAENTSASASRCRASACANWSTSTWARWPRRLRAAPTTLASSWRGAPDLNRLALFGHSRGGDGAVALTRIWLPKLNGVTCPTDLALVCC